METLISNVEKRSRGPGSLPHRLRSALVDVDRALFVPEKASSLAYVVSQ